MFGSEDIMLLKSFLNESWICSVLDLKNKNNKLLTTVQVR